MRCSSSSSFSFFSANFPPLNYLLYFPYKTRVTSLSRETPTVGAIGVCTSWIASIAPMLASRPFLVTCIALER